MRRGSRNVRKKKIGRPGGESAPSGHSPRSRAGKSAFEVAPSPPSGKGEKRSREDGTTLRSPRRRTQEKPLRRWSGDSGVCYDLVLAGAGAASVFAALALSDELAAQQARYRILLIEQNRRPMKKLAATGAGRCNLAHREASPERYFSLRGNPRTLAEMIFAGEENAGRAEAFYARRHIFLREEQGRLYPHHFRAETVCETLLAELLAGDTEIACGLCLESFVARNAYIDLTLFDSVEKRAIRLQTRFLLFGSGGLAAAELGSGEHLQKQLAQTFSYEAPASPGLVPLCVRHAARGTDGLRFQSLVRLHLGAAGARRRISVFGEILFTSYGLSGIPLLDLSALRAAADAAYFESRGRAGEELCVRIARFFSEKTRDGQNEGDKNKTGNQVLSLDLLSSCGLAGAEKGRSLYGEDLLSLESSEASLRRLREVRACLRGRAKACVLREKDERVEYVLLPFFPEKLRREILRRFLAGEERSARLEWEALLKEIRAFLAATQGKVLMPELEDLKTVLSESDEAGTDSSFLRIYLLLRFFSFEVSGDRGFSQAQISLSGFPVEKLRPHSLCAAADSRFFFAGECLDVSGPCGGYNLHFALLSAMHAAKELAQRLRASSDL